MDNVPEGQWKAMGGKGAQLMLAGRAIGVHRRAVWDQTKHYTWWLLAIGGALMYLATRTGTGFPIRAAAIAVGLFIGLVLSLIAYRVTRRECMVLNEQSQAYERLVKEQGLEEGLSSIEVGENKGVGGLFGGLFTPAKMRVWDWYQATFMLASIVFFAGFVAVIVYAAQK